MLFWNGFGANAQEPADSPVRLSEVYELANIILALTPYGQSDPWEVSRSSAYYQEVMTHFAPYQNHPLLKRVNYSRPQWESYLSFRTDAYAFAFDSTNQLVRQFPLVTNRGFNPFEENRALVEDFARVSGFRQFYQDHRPYYQSLASAYLTSQHYPAMRSFLEQELGRQSTSHTYAIVLSPLVGRMNCHRTVAGTGTDFITLPSFLLAGKAVREATPEEIASGTHMLFTELDHAFVNPLTERHRALVRTNFDNRVWDQGSGYQTDSLATFNEYMTWALYDLFVEQHFPAVAARVTTDWTLQNETRGFYASALFTKELVALYHRRKAGQTLNDLYPAFLKRLGIIQATVRQPTVLACNLANTTINDSVATYVIQFSEPMQLPSSFDIVLITGESGNTRLERQTLTRSANGLRWSKKGRVVQFRLKLVRGTVNRVMFNHPWQARTPLQSRRGVDLPPYSQITTTVTGSRQP